MANDERAVALVKVTGSRQDRTLNERQIVIFELDGDKVRSASFVYERPSVHDAFWF